MRALFIMTISILASSRVFASSPTYEMIHEIDCGGSQVSAVSINPSGECVAAVMDTTGKVTVVNACEKANLWSTKFDRFVPDVQTFAWSGGGKYFVVSTQGKLTMFLARSGEVVKEFVDQGDAVYVTSDFSANAQYLAAKDFKNEAIVIFDVGSGKVVQKISTPASEMRNLIRSTLDDRLAFSADNRILFVSGMRSFRAYSIENGEKIREFNSDVDLFSAVFGRDARLAAFATATPGVQGEAKIIDLQTMKIVAAYENLGNVYGGTLRLSEDEKQLFWMSMKGGMKIWQVINGALLLATDNPAFTDPYGTFIMVNSRPLLRFTFDLAPSHKFFMSAHPGTTTVEVWKLP